MKPAANGLADKLANWLIANPLPLVRSGAALRMWATPEVAERLQKYLHTEGYNVRVTATPEGRFALERLSTK